MYNSAVPTGKHIIIYCFNCNPTKLPYTVIP